MVLGECSHHIRTLSGNVRPRSIQFTVRSYHESRHNHPNSRQSQYGISSFVLELVWRQAQEQEHQAALRQVEAEEV